MDQISNAPVESWKVEDLKPYERNNKKHPADQIKSLANSIKDQGLNDPITVDEQGVIISGHGRLEAVKLLGWTHVPVRCLKGITETQAMKLRIAANKTTGTEYDIDVLQDELNRLSLLGEEVTDIGFNDRELEMLMTDIGEMDDVDVADIDQAVSDFDDEVEESAREAEKTEVPISKAFDIKKLPLKAQRTTGLFMKRIESQTGKTGAEALIAHMEGILND